MQSAFLQPSLFNTSLNPAPDTLRKDLCVAYFAACKGKKKKQCVREFDQHWEDNLRQLHHELLTGTYQIRPSTCFIIRDPVQREVFAADFRDRIVHHLLYNYLAPIYEKQFIYDSYSCRVGKGTHFGIQRMKRFMRASSENFTKEAWVLKLDVKGFFMNIDKRVLRGMIENFLQ
ncbi:MAG: hypothetical protein LBD11_03820 [Candidatus Peribacteria bacterium]|jgi:retron-type reverse transcriptase|nr:hypothetical protein [Candidatus Peribacteria bacterium]